MKDRCLLLSLVEFSYILLCMTAYIYACAPMEARKEGQIPWS